MSKEEEEEKNENWKWKEVVERESESYSNNFRESFNAIPTISYIVNNSRHSQYALSTENQRFSEKQKLRITPMTKTLMLA